MSVVPEQDSEASKLCSADLESFVTAELPTVFPDVMSVFPEQDPEFKSSVTAEVSGASTASAMHDVAELPVFLTSSAIFDVQVHPVIRARGVASAWNVSCGSAVRGGWRKARARCRQLHVAELEASWARYRQTLVDASAFEEEYCPNSAGAYDEFAW
jgi:hypothetical protein